MIIDYQQVPGGQQIHLTRAFQKATTHYTLQNSMLLLYQILKFSIGLILLYYPLQCQQGNWIQHTLNSNLHIWIASIILHSLSMIVLYYQQVSFISNDEKKQVIAQKLDQIRFVEDDENRYFADELRAINILTRQIKYEVYKSICCGKFLNKTLFVMYQVLFVQGLIMFFTLFDKVDACDQQLLYFMSIIIVLSIYQYIDFYIVMVFVILCLPFLIILGIYLLFQMCIKHKEKQEIAERFQPIKYKQNKIEGDQQCSICYTAYELDENVIILECSKLHHFHDQCIKAWLNVSNTCPLCRAQI